MIECPVQPYNFELQVRRKSGAVRHASMPLERLDIDRTNCLLTMMRDITQHKHAGKAPEAYAGHLEAETRK